MKKMSKFFITTLLIAGASFGVSSSFALFTQTPSNIDIKINVDNSTISTYKVNFFLPNDKTTPIHSIDVDKGGTILESDIPANPTDIDNYSFKYWSLDDVKYETEANLSSLVISNDTNLYAKYVGYFIANDPSVESERIPLYASETEANIYTSDNDVASNLTKYNVFEHIYSTEEYQYQIEVEKTIYCESVSGKTEGKYTFNYNNVEKTSSAIRTIYYQSLNSDFGYGTDPYFHMFSSAGATTEWPGVAISWVKDDGSNNKIWKYDIDATLYSTIMVTRNGQHYGMYEGSGKDRVNLTSGYNIFWLKGEGCGWYNYSE